MSQAPDAAEREGDGGADAVRILVADADCALYGLLDEWLVGSGYVLAGACAPDEPAHDGYHLIVVDLPFPREGGDVLSELRREHPGTPIIALSASFFPGVELSGALARALGVASVLPKPVTRETLLVAVRHALRGAR
jgi:DNA-binding response OmpR family regulator